MMNSELAEAKLHVVGVRSKLVADREESVRRRLEMPDEIFQLGFAPEHRSPERGYAWIGIIEPDARPRLHPAMFDGDARTAAKQLQVRLVAVPDYLAEDGPLEFVLTAGVAEERAVHVSLGL